MKGDSKIRPILLEVSGEKCTEGTDLRAQWWEVMGSSGCWLLRADSLRTVHIKVGL